MKTAMVISTAIMLLGGCAMSSATSDPVREPDTSVYVLRQQGRHHEAMRELPKAMAAWERYTERTGSTSEGAAGYLYHETMWSIAKEGDADWGKILDDPTIPYEYKIDMIFEIMEARLFVGSAWYSPQADAVIMPRSGSVASWEEVNDLLRKHINEQQVEAQE